MSTLTIKDSSGAATGEYELSSDLLVLEKGSQAVQEAVVAYLANQRQGNASTIGKGEVAGSNKKLWKQKGTGRARTGHRQSPIWRGGGTVFGPKPRDYTKKLTRAQAKLAFSRAFSEKVEAGQITVLDSLELSGPKTKEFSAVLQRLDATYNTLVIVGERDDNLVLAARNIPKVEVTTAAESNTYQLVRYKNIFVTKAGLEVLEKRLANK